MRAGRGQGFTLLELLIGALATMTLMTALYGVFHGTLRLRERTYEQVERDLPAGEALRVLRADLAAARTSSPTLGGVFLGVAGSNGQDAADQLRFTCASGRIGAEEFGFDLQEVEYALIEPLVGDAEEEGLDLARVARRNLLGTAVEEPEPQRMLGGVRALSLEYYDGSSWRTAWDSELEEGALPAAVRVRLEWMGSEPEPEPRPIELVVELATTTTSADSGGAT